MIQNNFLQETLDCGRRSFRGSSMDSRRPPYPVLDFIFRKPDHRIKNNRSRKLLGVRASYSNATLGQTYIWKPPNSFLILPIKKKLFTETIRNVIFPCHGNCSKNHQYASGPWCSSWPRRSARPSGTATSWSGISLPTGLSRSLDQCCIHPFPGG